MEQHVGAYQSYRMRQIRTPRKIIETNSAPEVIPPPPPCRLVMRIKKGDELHLPAGKRDPRNLQGIKMKMTPQYGVQLVQQQGIVKAIPVNISQGGAGTGNAVLKSGDKIPTSFAQLVQTSTGKHLLLTTNAGSIPVTTTTPGRIFLKNIDFFIYFNFYMYFF